MSAVESDQFLNAMYYNFDAIALDTTFDDADDDANDDLNMSTQTTVTSKKQWLIDTGAMEHICADKPFFIDYRDYCLTESPTNGTHPEQPKPLPSV